MDLNQDGHLDILSGSYSDNGVKGMAGLFQVLWGSADGFKKATPLQGTDDKPLIIGDTSDRSVMTDRICTRPTAVDWDADGDLDLIVGNFKGTFFLFRGEGKGTFSPKSETIKIGDVDLAIDGHHSDPFCFDIDADGDLDLLSGSTKGGVQWAENTAGKGKEISVKAFRPLVPGSTKSSFWADEEISPAGSTRVWVDDVNGDGKIDLLVGDTTTINSPAEGMSKDDAQAAEAEWNKKMVAVKAELQNPKSKERAIKKYRTLSNSRTEFQTQERTGFVWLYLGK